MFIFFVEKSTNLPIFFTSTDILFSLKMLAFFLESIKMIEYQLPGVKNINVIQFIHL
jgi:hypothetical protein